MSVRPGSARAGSFVVSDLLDQARTLPEAFAALVERAPDHPALTVLDRNDAELTVTPRALWARARAVQAALSARGLARGALVPLILPTSTDVMAVYLGTLLAGGIPTLLAPPSNRIADGNVYAERLGRILAHADAGALVCDRKLGKAIGRIAPRRTALLTPADIPLDAAPPTIVVSEPEDVATVQYSSGSTGAPHGVLLSHRAILNNIRAMRERLSVTAADVSVNWVPLYHDMGLIGTLLLPLLTGGTTVLIPTTDFMREPTRWLHAMHRYHATLSWAPNFALALCAHRLPDADLVDLDLASLRIIIVGAEPLLPGTLEAFSARFARYSLAREAITPAWGLAENALMATVHPVDEPPLIETIDREALVRDGMARPSPAGLQVVAVGRPLARHTIEIRDSAGRALGERQVGEVWLRSDCLFAGYHNDPAETAETLVDGWLDTGDRAYFAGPDLFFVTRRKDVIVIGGMKYAPHDIENAANSVAGVRQGCVVAFGVLDPERGTEDVAVVAETRETDPDTLARLRDAIRDAVMRATGLPARHVLLVPAGGVVKTTSGKLARAATRERYAAALDFAGDRERC